MERLDPLVRQRLALPPQSGSKVSTLRHALWIGALAGMAPDLDVLIQSDTDLLALEYRHHTLAVFCPRRRADLCLRFYPLVRKRLTFWRVAFSLRWASAPTACWMPARPMARSYYG